MRSFSSDVVVVFDRADETLAALPVAALVALWNALADLPVKKFESREVGARRLGTLLREKFGVAGCTEDAEPTAEPETTAGDKTPPAPASADTEASAAAAPEPVGTIRLLHETCKSADGTKRAARWEVYQKMNGRTVAEFVKAGVPLSRLRADALRGVVAIEPLAV